MTTPITKWREKDEKERMMEFNLSDKIHDNGWEKVILADNVREFIRRLKIKIKQRTRFYGKEIPEIIDKLAGEKLI